MLVGLLPSVQKMDDSSNSDRAAILARRQYFILAALAGCHSPSPSQPPLPDGDPPFRWQLADLPQPPLPPYNYDADTNACEDDSASPDKPTLDARTARVESLVIEAQEAHARGDLECAMLRFEQAWIIAPERRELVYFVGAVAFEIGNCTSAKSYLELYLFGEKEHYKTMHARQMLDDIERRDCAVPPPPVRDDVIIPCLSRGEKKR